MSVPRLPLRARADFDGRREGSSLGYDADEVKEDHLHNDARLLLFFSAEELAAYVLWRFDWEETAQDDVEVEVAYWSAPRTLAFDSG